MMTVKLVVKYFNSPLYTDCELNKGTKYFRIIRISTRPCIRIASFSFQGNHLPDANHISTRPCIRIARGLGYFPRPV